MSIKIKGEALEAAANQSMDVFLSVFTNAYQAETKGVLNADNMHLLNGMQHSLMAYSIFKEEVMQGGFVQLIQNGYGSYIFLNPFAKSLRIFGLDELAKLIYKARDLYDLFKDSLERETTEEEFHALYEEFEAFEELEERFFEIEEECTDKLACYVDEHLEEFAEIGE
jgi:hypothetical protein